jgi:hypothetical protein
VLVHRVHRFLALCEDAVVAAKERHDREAARTRIFDSAQTLADALVDGDGSERWDPLRDLILAGLEAGGLRHAPDSTALRTASGELAAAALDARRRVADKTDATRAHRSSTT